MNEPALATWFIRPELSGNNGVSCYFTLIISRGSKIVLLKNKLMNEPGSCQ